MKLEYELQIAKEIARTAGNILLDGRNSKLEIEIKEDKSPVTNMDKKVSNFIFNSLAKKFSYDILDEERTIQKRTSKYCWVVDPIDGTKSYISGDTTFGTFIGLLEDYNPVLGVVCKPSTNEIYYAVKGQGAFVENMNTKLEQQLSVSNTQDIEVLISGHRMNSEFQNLLDKIKPDKITSMYSSLKIIEVAKGNASLFLCPKNNKICLWDMCAPSVILQEAGGIITDLDGNLIDYNGPVENLNGVIASNRIVYNKVLMAVK